MIVSATPRHSGASGGGGASRVVSGCGRGQGGRGPRFRPRPFVGPSPPASRQCVVIGPDRPPAGRHSHFATGHPAHAVPLVNRGHGPGHRAGDIGQAGCVRLEDRRVPHRARAGTRQAAVTQQRRDPTPTAPRRAFGGRKPVASEVCGDLRTAQTTAAYGVDPVEADLVRRELVIPRDRSNDLMRTAPPPAQGIVTETCSLSPGTSMVTRASHQRTSSGRSRAVGSGASHKAGTSGANRPIASRSWRVNSGGCSRGNRA